ncbi:MAG: hypothetical protein AUK35_05355 [Zetaproteobacteria bacterium CG2_30_46_52]|nr:MAG: hypothetical protein AUK35_05355 [Zetaproteobacteria bacterium CG2_30_46_52]
MAMSVFSEDYQQARQAFLSAAKASGGALESFKHNLSCPKGLPLFTDVLWLGKDDAKTVLLMLSATHGVEGFSGSAAQIDFLNTYSCGGLTLPSDVAVLLIHALNPHGFAWLRRVDEAGIDLNRNYVDFSKSLPINAGYAQLANVLVPCSLDAATLQTCETKLQAYKDSFGEVAYEKALSAGQYAFPEGLFYGGQAPCWSRLLCEQMIEKFSFKQRVCVAVIDFHTGLGPFGYGEPICEHLPNTQGNALARLWYGDSLTEPALGTSTSVAKTGLSDDGWITMLGDKLVFIALEFGTYDFENMKQVLRADHWLHAQGKVDWQDPVTQTIKANIRSHFYPATSDWEEMVLIRSRECIQQAIAGISAVTHN